MLEKRLSERMSFNKKIECMLSAVDLGKINKLMLSCSTFNISDTGMGIVADYPLEPGHVLKFDSFTPTLGPTVGVVSWSMRFNEKYRAGVHFIFR